MNKKDSDRCLNYAKKLMGIDFLGGCCKTCGNNNFINLCFHHKNKGKKDENLSRMFQNNHWSVIKKELEKCELFCNNCHREEHTWQEYVTRAQHNKKILLEAINKFKCEKCGYNKCFNALDFHHTEKELKNTRFSGKGELAYIKFNNIGDLASSLMQELEICEVLCANCHSEEHFDIEYFNKHKHIIYSKKENYKEKPKVDKAEIITLYNSGIGYKKIMEQTGCSKATICYYCKK